MVLVASLVITLCIAVVAGATYALFTDDVTTSTHLVAGNLDIGLVRVSGSKVTLDPVTGYLKETALDRQDFGAETDKTVFGVQDGELSAPGSTFVADLQLTNNGTVAFSYKVYIRLVDEHASELAEQLKVYYKADGATDYADLGYLSALEANEDKQLVLIQNGVMAKNTPAADFSVKIEFVNLDNNNEAMSKIVNFDLVVEAVQLTSDPAATTQP